MAFEDIHRPLTAAGFRGAIKWIIIISGVMLFIQQYVGRWIVPVLGMVPSYVLFKFWGWQPFTYMFLHGGIFHWLFNMLMLWMFGRELEVRWGTAAFLRFFFVCGLGAAACVVLLSPLTAVPTIGASGAVFGVLVAFAMMFPDAVLYLYFVVPVKAWQAVALFAFIEFFAGLSGGGAGLGKFAHLGGMATGYLYLRTGSFSIHRIAVTLEEWGQKFRKFFKRGNKPVVFHEITDDLVKEVDRILDKILREGVESLSTREKELMERYSKMKH